MHVEQNVLFSLGCQLKSSHFSAEENFVHFYTIVYRFCCYRSFLFPQSSFVRRRVPRSSHAGTFPRTSAVECLCRLQPFAYARPAATACVCALLCRCFACSLQPPFLIAVFPLVSRSRHLCPRFTSPPSPPLLVDSSAELAADHVCSYAVETCVSSVCF